MNVKFKTIRLQHWDYSSSGIYFITICSHYRECLFGEIHDDTMHMNLCGELVREEWFKSADIRAESSLDEMIVMPNHFHAIVGISKEIAGVDDRDIFRGSRNREPKSLSTFISQFKATTTRRVNEICHGRSGRLWQPRFHDRIIRDEQKLNIARQYVLDNPRNWSKDIHNPNRL